MSNKFNFDTAEKMCETILHVADTMESENERVQQAFIQLHETFKDQAYEEFQADFNAADRTMAQIISDLHRLNISLNKYKEKLLENV